MSSGASVVLIAGMLAAFNPCGVAMLPAYIVHLVAGRERSGWDGLSAGMWMTAGFLVVFLVAGLLSSVFAAALGSAVAWIAELVGIGFVVAGVGMLFGKQGFSFHIDGPQTRWKDSRMAILMYGIAYALGSLGCTLPLFSILVLSSFHTKGIASGLLDFILYALGMGFIVTIISLASTLSHQLVTTWVRMSARWMGRFSGLITVVTGVYLVIYWFPYIRQYTGL